MSSPSSRDQGPPFLGAALVTGAQHAVRAQPCQDATRAFRVGPAAVLAVSDGHGSEAHPYSADGSQIAVEVATELLTQLWRERLDPSLGSGNAPVAREVGPRLARAMLARWNERVKRHGLAMGRLNPEITQPSPHWDDVLKAYGCTIAAALIGPDTEVFLVLGDSSATLVEPERFEHFFPERSGELFGTQVRSMCDRNALDHIRYLVRPAPQRDTPLLAMLVSDGVSDSYINHIGNPDPALLAERGRYFLKRLANEAPSAVMHSLPGWVAAVSERGSGDDASIVLAYWPAPVPVRPQPDRESRHGLLQTPAPTPEEEPEPTPAPEPALIPGPTPLANAAPSAEPSSPPPPSAESSPPGLGDLYLQPTEAAGEAPPSEALPSGKDATPTVGEEASPAEAPAGAIRATVAGFDDTERRFPRATDHE